MTDYTYRYNRNCVELKQESINGSHFDKESAIFHKPIDKNIAKITSFYYFSLRMQSQNFALWNFMQIDWIYSKVWCDVQFPMSSFSKWMWIKTRQEEILNSNRNCVWFLILNLPMSIHVSAVHDEYEMKIEISIITISNRFAELDKLTAVLL